MVMTHPQGLLWNPNKKNGFLGPEEGMLLGSPVPKATLLKTALSHSLLPLGNFIGGSGTIVLETDLEGTHLAWPIHCKSVVMGPRQPRIGQVHRLDRGKGKTGSKSGHESIS